MSPNAVLATYAAGAPAVAATDVVVIPLPAPSRAGLGAVGAVLKIADAASKAAAFWQSIKGFFGGGKNADRFRANEEAYRQAMAGNEGALLFLRSKSCEAGPLTDPVTGEMIGCWATDDAKADAGAKYHAVLQSVSNGVVTIGTGGGSGSGSGGATGGGGGTFPVDSSGYPIGGGVPIGGAPIGQTSAKDQLLVLGALGIGLFALARMGKR